MRITDFPLVQEVKDEYLELRKTGKSRADAILEMQQQYRNELEYGSEDDALLFWVGLADAQYSAKELTLDVTDNAAAALHKIADSDWCIAQGDIDRRLTHYRQAPQPEKKFGKPRAKFRCSWEIGDTFAYRLSGEVAQSFDLAGKYVLLRKVDTIEFGTGELHPIVTVSLWEKKPFPQNTEEFQTVPMLKLSCGRFGNSKNSFEYRAEITIRSELQLRKMQLEFVGNFPNILMPKDEIIVTGSGFIMMLCPECIDRDCSYFWKMDQYITNNFKDPQP